MAFTIVDELPRQSTPQRTRGYKQLVELHKAVHDNAGYWVGATVQDLRPGERMAGRKTSPLAGIGTRINKHFAPFNDGYAYTARVRNGVLYVRLEVEEDAEE